MNLVELLRSVLPEGWIVNDAKDTGRHRWIGEWVEITSPVLDRRNDAIQIYARIYRGGIELTDDGYLFVENAPHHFMQMAKNVDVQVKYNVRFEWAELKTRAFGENLAERVQALVAAIAELDAEKSQ